MEALNTQMLGLVVLSKARSSSGVETSLTFFFRKALTLSLLMRSEATRLWSLSWEISASSRTVTTQRRSAGKNGRYLESLRNK